MSKALFLTDIHYPNHNPVVERIVKQFLKDYHFDHLVLGGDCFDANGISKFTAKGFEDGVFDTVLELEGFKKDYFQPLIKSSKNKKIDIKWTLGNHDGQRFTDFFRRLQEKARPEMYKLIKNQLDVKSRFPEVKFKDYNECHKIGKLYFTHGEYHNEAHAKKHATTYMKNIMYGHLHTYQIHTAKSKATGRPHTAYSMPCACKMNLDYLKNGASSWLNGFAVIDFLPNGNFFVSPIIIINNKTVYNGKTYI